MAKIKKTQVTAHAGKDGEQREHYPVASENINLYSHLEINMALSKKIWDF